MTIEESLQNIEDNFKKFSENMDVFLDSFAESLYDLKKQIKTENKTQEPSGLWKPKKYETYYYIDDYNNICYREFCNTELDNACKLIGNCFRTQEDAKKHLEHLKVETQLRDIAARLNKCREIKWKNSQQDKFYIELRHQDGVIITHTSANIQAQDVIYCLDSSFKDAAIAEIGEERLKEYLKEC